MWNGRVTFGGLWAAYVGPTDQATPHAHAALQAAFGADRDVAVRHAGGVVRARAVLIRPLVRHTVVPGLERVGFLYVEPQALLGRALMVALGESDVVAAGHLIAAAPAGLDPADTVARLERALAVVHAAPIDPRVTRALAALGESDGRPGAVGRAAREAGVSSARLRALARRELRMPLARWLLWRKLARAARAVADGASLAAAAAEGGFADQAHFARTMRRMFGVTPGTAAVSLR